MSELVDRNWVKSTFSEDGGNNCLQVRTQVHGNAHGVALRESTDPERVVQLSRHAFRSLLRDIRAGARA
ncbi:DUF397 domain-containing protein [Streptomyces sp. URMC 126]|uniref:DUF397 domain-containing protein n=1 Tax=Streptomyces sp. URMC 126 TaxID=3423401 RepID=UPI003F19AE7B